MTDQDRLRSLLLQVRRRWRTEVLLRALGRVAVFATLPLAAAATVVRWIDPPNSIATILAAAVVLAGITVAALTLWRVKRAPGARQVARFVEEQVVLHDRGRLDDVLVSAVDAADGNAGGFGDLVVRDALERLEAIEPSTIVTPPAFFVE